MKHFTFILLVAIVKFFLAMPAYGQTTQNIGNIQNQESTTPAHITNIEICNGDYVKTGSAICFSAYLSGNFNDKQFLFDIDSRNPYLDPFNDFPIHSITSITYTVQLRKNTFYGLGSSKVCEVNFKYSFQKYYSPTNATSLNYPYTTILSDGKTIVKTKSFYKQETAPDLKKAENICRRLGGYGVPYMKLFIPENKIDVNSSYFLRIYVTYKVIDYNEGPDNTKVYKNIITESTDSKNFKFSNNDDLTFSTFPQDIIQNTVKTISYKGHTIIMGHGHDYDAISLSPPDLNLPYYNNPANRVILAKLFIHTKGIKAEKQAVVKTKKTGTILGYFKVNPEDSWGSSYVQIPPEFITGKDKSIVLENTGSSEFTIDSLALDVCYLKENGSSTSDGGWRKVTGDYNNKNKNCGLSFSSTDGKGFSLNNDNHEYKVQFHTEEITSLPIKEIKDFRFTITANSITGNEVGIYLNGKIIGYLPETKTTTTYTFSIPKKYLTRISLKNDNIIKFISENGKGTIYYVGLTMDYTIDEGNPLKITSYSPQGNSVKINSNIVISFNKEVKKTTLNNSTILIKDSQGNQYKSSNIIYDNDKKEAIIQPDKNFPYNTNFTVTVKKDITGIYGTKLPADFSWGFKTSIHQVSVLYGGKVNLPQCKTGQKIFFSVYYKDPSNLPPQSVKLCFSDHNETMTSNTTTWSNGVQFNKSLSFNSPGTYTYYFKAVTKHGKTITFPEKGTLSIKVVQNAQGWDARVTHFEASETSLPRGGLLVLKGSVLNNSSTNTYKNLKYRFTIYKPNGTIYDQQDGILTELTPQYQKVVSKSFHIPSSPQGTYRAEFTILPDLDENYSDNTKSLTVYVGNTGTKAGYYFSSASYNQWLQTKSSYTFSHGNVSHVYYFGATSPAGAIYIGTVNDLFQMKSIKDHQYYFFYSGSEIILNGGTYNGNNNTYYAVISFGYARDNYVTYQNSTITGYPGQTIYFEVEDSKEPISFSNSPDFFGANHETINNWYRDFGRSESNKARYFFDLPSNAKPGKYTFFMVTNLSSGYYLKQLSIRVLHFLPKINNINENKISAEDQITINGSHFGSSGTVKFGDVKCTQIKQWTDSKIVCIVPQGIKEGNLYVLNSVGMSNGIPYTVISSTGNPEITSPIPDQSITGGEKILIADLDNVFWDPNNDKLKFDIKYDNSKLIINNDYKSTGKLYFTAKKGISGTTTVVASATDAYQTTVRDTFNVTIKNNCSLTSGTIIGNRVICYNTKPDTLVLIQKPNGGTNSYTYQWQESVNDKDFLDIAGANDVKFQPDSLIKNHYYRLVFDAGECGKVFSDTVSVIVRHKLVPAVIGNDQNILSTEKPKPVYQISGPSGGDSVFNYQWQSSTDNKLFVDIYGADSSTYQPPYLNDTTYYRLENISVSGCGSIYSDTLAIKVKPIVKAEFTSNTTLGKAPLTVHFLDHSTGYPTSWKWDFGDGENSSLQNPVHTYKKVGIYTVSLILRNKYSKDTLIKRRYISVLNKTSHFNCAWSGNPYQPMNILVDTIVMPNDSLQLGDEVGIFDVNTSDSEICVGAALISNPVSAKNPLTIIAAKDDPETTATDGFIIGHNINFKVWKAKEQKEVSRFFIKYNPNFDTVFNPLGTAIASLFSYTHYQPAWSGNPYQPMNVLIDSITLPAGTTLQPGDEVGLFDTDTSGNDICVGAGIVSGGVSPQHPLSIVASSDDPVTQEMDGFINHHKIIFKVWDSDSVEYARFSVKYNPAFDSLYTPLGTALVGLSYINTLNQKIPLSKGWNMMSLYVTPDSLGMLKVLKPLVSSGSLVKAIDEKGGFVQNIPGVGWMNTIGDMANTEGYYIKVSKNDTLKATGRPVDLPFTIPLQTGWNMMGYPVQSEQDAMKVLKTLMDSSQLVKVINEAGGFIQNIPGVGWMNTIGNFEPGEGYYVKVNHNTQITFNKQDKSAFVPAPGNTAYVMPVPRYFNKAFSSNPYYPMNIVVTNIDLDGLEVHAGDEVAAFDKDVCVGVGVVPKETGRPVNIVASLDDPSTEQTDGYVPGDNMTLRFMSPELGSPVTVTATTLSGVSVFTPLETKVCGIAASAKSVESHLKNAQNAFRAYPNPAFSSVTFLLGNKESAQVEIELTDLNGRVVRVFCNKTLPAGTQTLHYDLSGLPAGIYNVRVLHRSQNNTSLNNYKLVITR